MDAYKYMTLVLILFAAVPTVYYFFLFRRIIRTLGFDCKNPWFVTLEIVLCLIVWYFMSPLLTSKALFLYMIPMIDIFLMLADFILKKATKKTNDEAGRKIWKYVYGLCLIPLFLVTVNFIYGSINIRNIVQTDYVVTTEKEVPEEGYRVCFFADVHCGNALKPEDYENTARRIEAQNVDAVIMGGDLIDFNSEQEDVESMFASFGSIKTTQGVYYIFGNHDRLYDYKESVFSEEYITDLCGRNGIIVLQDEWVDFGNGIRLLGREDADDKYGRIRKTEEEMFVNADTDDFILVADHQPVNFALLARLGADLEMSGHLHAGQMLPFSLILKFTNKEHVTWGRYLITQKKNYKRGNIGPAKEGEETATAIVTAGLVGWNYPIRSTGVSEYCIIDIVKEK